MFFSCRKSLPPWLPPLLFIFLFAVSAHAQFRNWRTFTNMQSMVRLVASDGNIWAATTGGLLQFTPAENNFSLFTNAEGLSSNDISALALDKLGRVWVGQRDGNINIYDPANDEFETIIEYRNFVINDILTAGDTVYIALTNGVGEYRIDKAEPKEIYKQLGTVFNKEIPATRLWLAANTLFVGTDAGVASAGLDQPNLKAPQSWQNTTTAHGLPSRTITGFADFQGQVIVATNRGLAAWNGEAWTAANGNLPDNDILALSSGDEGNGEALVVATVSGVFISIDLQNWELYGGFSGYMKDVTITDNKIWGASNNQGLASYEGDWQWTTFEPNTPKTNKYSALAVDQDGTLWATSGGDGFLSYDGETWNAWEEFGSDALGDYRAVIIDDFNRPWMGVWGRGVRVLSQTENGAQLDTIDAFTGELATSTNNNLNFPVVTALEKDASGNIWIANWGAISGQVIAVVTPDGEWGYFSTTGGAVKSDVINRLYVDTFGRVWYGTGNVGVGVIDHKGTPLDPSDDEYFPNAISNSELFSPVITGLTGNSDGTIFIGTNEGLNTWFSNQVSRQFGLISTDIRVARIDPAFNIWIGASGGVTVIAADGSILENFTTGNSPLVSNSVTDFAFDSQNGTAYIGTTNGLSAVSTPFTEAKSDFEQLSGFPNPFIIGDGGESFTVTNLVLNSGVQIFTEDGRLVRKLEAADILGPQARWDGKDANGNYVASGVYLFVAFTNQGLSATGKVAVIRK